MRGVFDGLVGFIHLEEVEAQLLEHPIVTRLANIKQLSLAGGVFPGASHSRLSHALGTMHYAGRIATACRKAPRSRVGKDFVQKARVAALLHDIGHPALSHAVELMFRRRFNTALAGKAMRGRPMGDVGLGHRVTRAIQAFAPEGNPFDNDLVSAYLIRESSLAGVLEKAGLDPEEVSAMVANTHPLQVYNQILHGGLDADKLDYLQRDGHATGVGFGVFDVEQILRHLGVHKDVLYIEEDAANACLHFVFSRYFWYSQVIHNKNVSVLERMAQVSYQSLAENELLPTATEFLDLLGRIATGDKKAENEWCGFTDAAFFSAIRTMRKTISSGKRVAEGTLPRTVLRDFLERILTQRPLKCVVRLDAVKVGHMGANNELQWLHQHPRHQAFERFEDWLGVEMGPELASKRIIMTNEEIPLIKPIDDERPIQVKTPYDSEPTPLQQHYYSMILPMAAGREVLPRFAIKRIYCVDELIPVLEKRWKALTSRVR